MASNPCHRKLVGLLQTQERSLNLLYGRYATEMSYILKRYRLKSSSNTWKGNARAEKEIDALLLRMQSEMEQFILGGVEQGWDMSNVCNDNLTNKYLKGIDVRNAEQYFSRNLEALDAFKARRIKGLGLSDRVWNLTYQTKDQIETVLQSQIMEGRSAAKIAKDLKGYLVEPDRRYRRIRDKNGKLVYTNPAKDYHPGQGIYRSSYKNALRVARNETNIAYRSADNERRQQLDFVTGVEVHLSDAHPSYDICDPLAGKYPKDFVFLGWHPNCICFSTNILLPQQEFQDYLNGGKIRQQRYVRTIPKSTQNYLNKHSEQIKGWKNKPYFIRDNFKNTKDGFALKKSVTNGLVPDPSESPINYVPEGLSKYERALKIPIDRSVFMFLKKDTPLNPKGALRTKGAFYHSQDNYVKIPIDNRRKRSKWKSESTIYHEFGHAADWQNNLKDFSDVKLLMNKYRNKFSKDGDKIYKSLSTKTNNRGFDAFQKSDFDTMEMVGALDDTLMSLNPKYGQGHSREYFNIEGRKEAEFIAHAFENKYAGNPEFEKLAPDLYKEMIDLIDLLLTKIE